MKNKKQIGNYNNFVDFNIEEWRKKLADTDHQIRGSIVFFEFSQNKQDLSDILASLGMMEKLMLCFVHKSMKMEVNVYRNIHRKSVEIQSWALIPETEVFEKFPKVCERAQQLIKYRWNTEIMRQWIRSLYHCQENKC